MRLNNMDLRARVSKHGCGLLPTHGDDACKCVSERVCAGTARCAHAGGKGEHARTHACMHVRTHAHTHTHIHPSPPIPESLLQRNASGMVDSAPYCDGCVSVVVCQPDGVATNCIKKCVVDGAVCSAVEVHGAASVHCVIPTRRHGVVLHECRGGMPQPQPRNTHIHNRRGLQNAMTSSGERTSAQLEGSRLPPRISVLKQILGC